MTPLLSLSIPPLLQYPFPPAHTVPFCGVVVVAAAVSVSAEIRVVADAVTGPARMLPRRLRAAARASSAFLAAAAAATDAGETSVDEPEA